MDAVLRLRELPLFSGLGSAERALIAGHVRRHCFRAGKTVLQCDQPGIALYVILSGKVRVHNETPEGREHWIAILSAGDLFGEMSLFDGRGHSANVTTLEPTEVLVLTREALLECMRKAPQIAVNLLATLAGRVRLANEINSEFVSHDAPARMAKQLLRLARRFGVKSPTGVEIDLRLTHSDLAGHIGVTRETAVRILREFQSLGWLENKRGRITLLREDKLMHRCGDEPPVRPVCQPAELGTVAGHPAVVRQSGRDRLDRVLNGAAGLAVSPLSQSSGSRTARPSSAER